MQKPVPKGSRREMNKSGAGRSIQQRQVEPPRILELRMVQPGVARPAYHGWTIASQVCAVALFDVAGFGAPPRSTFIHFDLPLRHWPLHVDQPSAPAQIAVEHCLRSSSTLSLGARLPASGRSIISYQLRRAAVSALPTRAPALLSFVSGPPSPLSSPDA